MTSSILFWILMLLALLYGGLSWHSSRTPEQSARFPSWGGNLLLWLILIVLGWSEFGPPIR